MNYPLISDYVSSILSAEDNFKELTHLRPVLDKEGQPIMSSGNFAVVFKMKDEQTGKLYAVKCFLKEQEGRAESYKLIEEELEFVSSNYLTPIRYMEDELFVDSSNTDETEFPILLMMPLCTGAVIIALNTPSKQPWPARVSVSSTC